MANVFQKKGPKFKIYQSNTYKITVIIKISPFYFL